MIPKVLFCRCPDHPVFVLSAACVLFCITAAGIAQKPLRVATYNICMTGSDDGEIAERLASGDDLQARMAARVIREISPDILLLNELDYDDDGVALYGFQRNYLEVSRNDSCVARYSHIFIAPSNTGVASGFDLNHNGLTTDPQDAYGYGEYPGQYGMGLLSRYPILTDQVRTFQRFLWKDMPDNAIPQGYYSDEAVALLRLSSKSHWDIPVVVEDCVVHLLVSHPTPPVFDGPEDRNGRRNHDEIRFWLDYITPGAGGYIYDDAEFTAADFCTPDIPRGGLAAGERFIILGDLNADPDEGDSFNRAIMQLLHSPLINTTFVPVGEGGSDPDDTGAFDRPLRVDYVLPSVDWWIVSGAVVWPTRGPLVEVVADASDHRMVYLDIILGDVASTSGR